MRAIRPARGSRIRRAVEVVATVINEDRAFRRAVRRMPRPVPWDWAKPRILPLLAGPYLDADDDPPVRGISEVGCAVVYGLEVGGAFPLVDQRVAQRWECSAEQIHRVAVANLGARASRLPASTVRGGTLSGRIIRMVDREVGWASSLLLVPDQLKRLFGSTDQVFGAPGRSVLISLPLRTPSEVVAHILIDLEMGQTWPLMLDPFVLLDGRLYWDSGDDSEDDVDEQDHA
jgi:hypothetical protein